ATTSMTAICEEIIRGLTEAVRHELPPGWILRPFGSFVQDTMLPGTALDVALYFEGIEEEGQSFNAALGLAAALMRKASGRFELISPLSASGAPAASGPVRLLAGDFSSGQRLGKQELAIYHGDVATGVFDLLLRQALSRDPQARSL
ncbi:unnamed protein product, partial [Polarella glacialis]